jgi:hypothetical protein
MALLTTACIGIDGNTLLAAKSSNHWTRRPNNQYHLWRESLGSVGIGALLKEVGSEGACFLLHSCLGSVIILCQSAKEADGTLHPPARIVMIRELLGDLDNLKQRMRQHSAAAERIACASARATMTGQHTRSWPTTMCRLKSSRSAAIRRTPLAHSHAIAYLVIDKRELPERQHKVQLRECDGNVVRSLQGLLGSI